MSLESILSRLDRVRPTSSDRYRAACPVHGGKGYNLSIKETGNGDVIAHCFKCGANGLDLVRSIGLTSEHLFREALPQNDDRYFSKKEINDLDLQVWFCVIASSDIKQGRRLNKQDYDKYRACLYSLAREYDDLKKAGHTGLTGKIDTMKLLGKLPNEFVNKDIDWGKVCQKLSREVSF